MNFLTNVDPSWIIFNPLMEASFQEPTGQLNSNIVVDVFPDWYKQITVSWKIPASWGNCSFHVYYDESVTTSSRRLTNAPISTPYFQDFNNQEYSKFKRGFYTIEVILPSGTRVRSYPTSYEPKRRDKLEKIANEVQRREYMLLSKFAGVKSFFFKRKTYGPRCPRCWNELQERVMDDHCPVCYGTSFEGGYWDPIPIYVQYEQTSKNKVKDYLGAFEPNSISGWTISIPEMSPRDLVMRGGDYNIYKVIGIQNTEIQTKQVRQILSLTQFAKGDVENLLGSRVLNNEIEYLQDGLESQFTKNRINTRDLDTELRNDHDWNNQKQTHLLPKYQIPELPIPDFTPRTSFVLMTDTPTSQMFGEVRPVTTFNITTANVSNLWNAESIVVSVAELNATTEDPSSQMIAEVIEQVTSEAQFTLTTQPVDLTGFFGGAYEPLLYFDQNPDAAQTTTGAPVSMRQDFLAAIINDSTQDFETTTHMASGTTGPLVVSFTGPRNDVSLSISSTQTGLRYVDQNVQPNNAGRYNNTSGGSKYLEAFDNITAVFSGGEVTAFGFYGTDWNDFSGTMRIEVNFINGTQYIYDPLIFANAQGNLMFFGIVSDIAITSFRVFTIQDPITPEQDYFSIDDLIIGDNPSTQT